MQGSRVFSTGVASIQLFLIPFLNNCVASFGETYKKLQLFISSLVH